MSYHGAAQNQTVPHGTLVYGTKADAQCFNSHGLVKTPVPGRCYHVNVDGVVKLVVATGSGVLKYAQSKPQTAPPFAVLAGTAG